MEILILDQQSQYQEFCQMLDESGMESFIHLSDGKVVSGIKNSGGRILSNRNKDLTGKSIEQVGEIGISVLNLQYVSLLKGLIRV